MEEQSDTKIYEDEIDLKELFKTIKEKRIFILGFTFIATLLVFVYLSFRIPIYEAKAIVKIAEYDKIYLDDASELSEELNILFIEIYKNKIKKESYIENIIVLKKQKNFLSITSEAISNEKAIKKLNEVVNYIQEKHKNILEDIYKRKSFEIQNIELKIKSIKEIELASYIKSIKRQEKILEDNIRELKTINSIIKKIENTNPSLTALKLMEKSQLLKSIMDLEISLFKMKNDYNSLKTKTLLSLEEEKVKLESLLLPHNYKNTEVVGSIMTNDEPIKPKKCLVIVVSLISSLLLAVFLVFFVNFIKSVKEN